MNRCVPLVPVVLLVAAVGAEDAGKQESPEDAIRGRLAEIARLTKKKDGEPPRELFVRDVERSRMEVQPLLDELSGAEISSVEAKGARALVSFEKPGEDGVRRGVLMEQAAGEWKLACASSFVLEGGSLDEARGRRPAKVRLGMRTDNGPYGPSAYSFTYATGDMKRYKNRVDLWYCHNGDFHVRGAVADVGKRSLKSVKSIPLDAKWGRVVRAEKGHCYVLRCGADERRDFFVALRVKRLKKVMVELEWTLLAGGRNSPASIHEAQPLDEQAQRSGADGTDGLCGKRG